MSQTRLPNPQVAPAARPPATPRARRRAPRCRASLDAAARQWNRFYGWLVKQSYHRRSYANSRQFTRRVGDRIQRKLQRLTRGKRTEAMALAMRLLGLRARTVVAAGSRWDCTTRMLQLAAQARRLAGSWSISYTGYRRGRLKRLAGRKVFRGYHLTRQVITLMAVAHYREPKLARRNMAWRSPLLAAGGLWTGAHHRRLRVGDIFWYPDYGPGHFGTVLHRSRDFVVVVEGYWKGQPTAIHVYRRDARVTDRCVQKELGALGGFRQLYTGRGPGAPWAKNVYSGLLDEKGPLRIGRHR